MELIADARVAGFDEELVAVEERFLDFARRGDHKHVKLATQHFRACARAEGSQPPAKDQFTPAFVGDRCVGRFEIAKSDGQTVADTLEKFTRPPAANDDTTLAAAPGGRAGPVV